MIRIIIIVLLLSSSCIISQTSENNELREVEELFNLTEDSSISSIEKLSYAERAKKIALEIENDTLIVESYRIIASIQYQLKNFNLFKKASKEYLNFSVSTNDSLNIARAYGYLGKFYFKASISDSSYFYYYNAEKIYKAIGNSKSAAFALSEIAIIQKNEKDFIGSEVTTVEAISLLEPINEYRKLSSLYNNLGIIYNELGQYDQAITYHEKALKFRETLDNDYLENTSINNIAVVYKNSKQYDKAKVSPLAKKMMEESNLSVDDLINGLRRISTKDVELVKNKYHDTNQ